MGKADYDKYTRNGKVVIWYNSLTEGEKTSFDVDLERIDVSVSYEELLKWLENEKGSKAEIFKGNPKDVLKRGITRANDELNKNYKWTSYGMTVHGNKKGAVFTDKSMMSFKKLQRQLNKVHSKSKSIISCGSNSSGMCELPVFQIVDMQIDKHNCTLEFTPAQVYQGITNIPTGGGE